MNVAGKRKGTIQPFKSKADGRVYYRARIAHRDGFREWVDVPEDKRHSQTASANFAAYVQEREDAEGRLYLRRLAKLGKPADPGAIETVRAYAARWLAEREERKLSTTEDDRGRLERYVLPAIGHIAIRDVKPEDLVGVVEALDARVRDPESRFAWKTATHVWGNVTKLFADACASKRRDLRVRVDNPAREVRGPDRGHDRAKQYLWPAEALALVSSQSVPLDLRRFFAVSAYLYARPSEVEGLRWSDVDWRTGRVQIQRSIERKERKGTSKRGSEKTTKTKTIRKVPIEPALLPLLVALYLETGGTGRVFPRPPSASCLSERLRRFLTLAGVTREALHTDDATNQSITWYHATRSAGITWCAVRGDEPMKLMRRAGHTTFSTTLGYIREAETLDAESFGDVFPALPLALLGDFTREELSNELSKLSGSDE